MKNKSIYESMSSTGIKILIICLIFLACEIASLLYYNKSINEMIDSIIIFLLGAGGTLFVYGAVCEIIIDFKNKKINENTVDRKHFIYGDIVETEDGRTMMFIKAQGFDMKVIADINNLEEEGYSKILKFAKDFNPGMTHISNA